MNIGEMKDSIRFKVDDLKSTRYQDPHLLNAINEAFKHVYRELIRQNTFTDVLSTTVDFISGSQEIEFTALANVRLQKIIHVQDANGFPIPIYSEALSKRSDVRSVYVKRILKTISSPPESKASFISLGWYVCPSSSFTITVIYAPRLLDVSANASNATVIDNVPTEHHDVVVLRAVILLLGTDEDNARLWVSLYQEALTSMKESIEFNNDETDTVVDLQTEDYYASDRS